MTKKNKIYFILSAALLAAFILWTVLVSLVDLQAIGPENSVVGLAKINGAFHKLTGEHLWMYDLTDLLSLIPLGLIAAFGIFGLVQWIKRKHFMKVDFDILALGVFYIAVMAVFVFFEVAVVNYRPVLIEGVLEASYPSSTTMLVMCVMPTAMIQTYRRIKNKKLRSVSLIASAIFTSLMVVFRLISGVHWLTDIIGGAFFSAGAVLLYYAVCELKKKA